MQPLILLATVTLLGRGTGWLGVGWLDSWPHALQLGLAATATFAAGCLGLLLVIMFPANVSGARRNHGVQTMPLPIRTVVQAVFLAATATVALS